MPPFSVRQKIQKKYDVDRRHVYDWFHNRGLRVSSSEKRNEQRAARLKEVRTLPDTRIQKRIRTRTEIAAAASPAPSPATSSTDSGSSTPL
ncbi:hypothetical protein BC835DRAFT_1299844 [Cytidiella melzeri]|nr:hypothetical protein BC835DRAFT_1299844 [Cytidiella melzeri]